MILRLTILFLLCFCFFSNAQKEDRNWVFGFNTGMNFNDTSNIQTLNLNVNGEEVSASISDSSGNLIMFLGGYNQILSVGLKDYTGNDIIGSENLLINGTLAQGALFIPKKENQYYLIHTVTNTWDCQNSCIDLYYSLVELISGDLYVTIKNQVLIENDNLIEGIAAVKRTDGKSWWIITHQKFNGVCTNLFYRFLINSNGISGPFTQNIGTPNCEDSYQAGEITFSKKGNKLSCVIWPDGIVDVFDFDRCSGLLSSYINLELNSNLTPYSSEFSSSENILYLSTGAFGSNSSSSKLFQYNLIDSSRRLIWKDDTISHLNMKLGQLQIAPNNKIYVPYTRGLPISEPGMINHYLSVIDKPDSLGAACDFQPFSFYLGDSSYTSLALPNMPNYNLGPISIYKADAGKNQTICLSQQEKGTYLGDSTVAGVEYQWFPIVGMDSPNIAMPYVIPDSSRWYYVTISDTIIQNACQNRTDSVWVEFQSNLNAAFNYTIDDSVVTFESLSEEILVDHTWHFGNGTIGQGATTENIYPYSEDSITTMHIVSSRCDADTAYATFLIKAPEVPIDTNDVVDTLSIVNYAANTLRVYPNPTNNLLHFESPFMEQIEIFNLTRKQIISSSEPQVNVHNLHSGIYIYQVQMNNGTFVRGKFVKQ
jgi:hypothetical protein